MSDLTMDVLMDAKKRLDELCGSKAPPLFAMIHDKHMCSIVQARTHRKKRINKKYRKKYGLVEVPWDFVYMTGENVIAHPKTIEMIKSNMDKMQGEPSMYSFSWAKGWFPDGH